MLPRATLALLLALSLHAQAPQFEVATIKLRDPRMGSHAVSLRIDHGRASMEGATLRQIIVQAYAVPRVLVMGGPTWYDDDQYDLLAKAPTDTATGAEIRTMLQNLLVERCKLSIHRITKEVSVYNLVVARNGSKLSSPPPDDQPPNVAIDDRGAIAFKTPTSPDSSTPSPTCWTSP